MNLAGEIDLNVTAGEDLNQRFRIKMEECAADESHLAAFYDFQTYGSEYDEQIEKQFSQGLIAAVDGTDRLPPIAFPATQLYVAGVSWVTTRESGMPNMHMTSTTANLKMASSDNDDDIWSLAEAVDNASMESSWSKTFREYVERETALDRIPNEVEVAFIDGPLFTQNLMTQTQGRELLARMIGDKRRKYIGVIKDLSASWAISRWAACCLRPGEVYLICTIQQAFSERFGNASMQHVNKWVAANTSTHVRCVYRPAGKAFAFECAMADIPYTVALLRKDASPQIDHEIPRILQFVDADCRSSNSSGQVRNLLISQVHQRNQMMASDITDERNSR